VILERIERALEAKGCKARRCGTDSLKAPCPICQADGQKHDPGLSVTIKNGQLLLHCFGPGSCAYPALCDVLDIDQRECFADDKPLPQRPKVVAEYSYQNADGETVFCVKRLEPGNNGKRKTFVQARPDGGKVRNLPSEQRHIPYELPAVLEGVENNSTIFVVEGEKNADAINALPDSNIVATCNAGGAGHWREEHAAYLNGAGLVVVVADKDEEGRGHAAKVAATLQGKVKHLQIVESATGQYGSKDDASVPVPRRCVFIAGK
jgi:hypothetical protein